MSNERDYLRSVVEQIHADTHAALSATEARVATAVQEIGGEETAVEVTKYVPWAYAGGPNECAHGYAEGIPCPDCDAANNEDAPEPVSPPPVELPQEGGETARKVCDGSGWRHTNAVRMFERADGSTGYEPHHVRCHGCSSCTAEPVEAGVELPDEAQWRRTWEHVRDGEPVAQWRGPSRTPYFVPTAVERAIASQAAAEERSKWERRVDQATRAAERRFLDLREAREELARLREALEQIARSMPEYAHEEDGPNVALKIARRALEASASTEAK